eukprot:TRINITY_DN4723_c0_g1_i2.p1 TRINITY_DN4723_c0_g1~~TRINITY_DN4723_c0_g1_i2.p1  ORF type:complete len:751 (+),score=172.57 TRINITY_DN4723_c0_g1_i2:134-2386(+)
MDLSFSGTNFNAKKWINEALQSGRSPDEPLDSHASMLLMKLQVSSTDINTSLEELSNQAITKIPKTITEVEKLRKEAFAMKQRLDDFDENLFKIETRGGNPISILSELDRVKSNMEICLKAIQEAENLTKIMSEIDSLFGSNNIQLIASQVGSMQKSLRVLEDIPEFKDLQQSLTKQQDRLQDLLWIRLEKALQNHDTESARDLLSLYQTMERGDRFLSEYERLSLQRFQLWKTYDNSTPFLDWLRSFYSQLLNLLIAEMDFTAQVFKGDTPVVSRLLQQMLGSIQTSFEARLEPLPFETVIECYQETYLFSEQASDALSIEIMKFPEEELNTLKAVFLPYFKLQKQVATTQQQSLISKLRFPKGKSFNETLREIEKSIELLFSNLDTSLEQSLEFTHGTEIEGLTKVFSEVLVEYLNGLFGCVKELRLLARVDGEGVAIHDQMEDWSAFQASMNLLQIVSGLVTRLSSLDTLLKNKFLSFKSSLLFPLSKLPPNSSDWRERVHMWLESDKSVGRLRSFLTNLEDPSFRLFPGPTKLCASLKSAVQNFAFDTLFLFIREKLNQLPSLKIQTEVHEQKSELAPLPYITEIGEHLLTVPTQLEVASQALLLLDLSRISASNSPSIGSSEEEGSLADGDLELRSQKEEIVEGTVAHRWISQLCVQTVNLYINKILEIKPLSASTSAQLYADIAYLNNVMSELDVVVDGSLLKLQELLKSSPKELTIANRSDEAVTRKLVQAVAQNRGIALTDN